jgi:hypothetical protein
VILHRCFAWRSGARATEQDGALWWPRAFQGTGRHDNPDHYGCLYVTSDEPSAVVEQLARFRGTGALIASMLRRRGLPLALARLELADAATLIDLDDPAVLSRHDLRPSRVATRRRDVTQPQALGLWRSVPDAAGLRWWSTFEASWTNLTLFDRAAPAVALASVRPLTIADPAVEEACTLLGLAAGT